MKDRRTALCCLCLAVLVAAVYGRTLGHDFVNYDDNGYVYDNPFVKEGLSFKGLGWAFTTTRWGNWHPVTWLSHMLDVEIFGLRPWGHHLGNVLLHALNALLLFLVLRGFTGALWRSGFVAVLFAVHPLHVQSVAWVSERKDLLSSLLGLAALRLYLGYARRPSLRAYLATVVAFVLGLMAKPMLVTLPVLLLLLDWWPLGRVRAVREKIPLLAVAALFGIISLGAQWNIGALMGLDSYPLAGRTATALVSAVAYGGRMIVPANLAVFYPQPPGGADRWAAAGALALLVALSAVAVCGGRRRPYLLVGWLWYLATLLPVSGLVQVGHQAMADRYTYLPLTGLFLAVSWGLADAARGRRRAGVGIIVVAGLAVSALAWRSWQEAGHWKTSESLMRRALAVTAENYTAHNNLATALMTRGRYDEAIPHLREVLRIRPDHSNAYFNLGQILLLKGEAREAADLFAAALRLDPGSADARRLLRQATAGIGRAPRKLGAGE